MKWGWVWTDHGRPLPFADVFAQHLAGVQDRLGSLDAQISQQRRAKLRRLSAAKDERSVLHVRRSDATAVYLDAERPEQ